MLPIKLKNAVLLKDMSIKAKRKNMAVGIFVINILAALIFLFILLISNANLANFNQFEIQAFTWVFDGMVITECAIISILAPVETGPAISNERERQTLDVLMTTTLSNTDIILGKYLSSVAYMLLTIVSLLPFMTVVLLYGGISLLQLFAVFLSIIFTAMYLSAFGIYFSTVTKKSSHASAVNLAMAFLLIIGTIILTFSIKLISMSAYNASHLTSAPDTVGDWAYFILYLNPASTVFDVLDKYVGFNFGSAYHGMANIFDNTAGIDPNNFFVKHWALVGFIVQFIVGSLMLKAAASALSRTKRLKKRG